MRGSHFLMTGLLALAASYSLAAGDIEAGARKAEPCSACHGSSGISMNNLWPNLAGQKAGYLVKQMKAFRDGDRKDPIMTSFAQSLTDQDIEDLAAHFAALDRHDKDDNWYKQRKEQKTY